MSSVTGAVALSSVRALLLAALLLLLASGQVAAAGDGSIGGQLKNGSADSPVPGGGTVVLHIVDENDHVERLSTTADSAGHYQFDGLDTSASLRYLPVTDYQGAIYFPRPLKLDAQPHQTADITVYEATTSDQWIAHERANMLVQAIQPNELNLMEMGTLANVGDRTYVGAEVPPGGPRPTLRFVLPAGAYDLAPQFGLGSTDLTSTPDGFTVSSPIVPGRQQLAYSYSLPFDGDRLELRKRLEYPVAAFSLYLPDMGVQVDSPQLRPQGQAELGGRQYLLYSAQNLPRGTELRIQMSGLPTNARPMSQELVGAILGIGCAALAGGLLLVYYRRRAASERLALAASRNGHSASERDELERIHLLLALARLDQRFECGEISPEQYERERGQGKQRLVAFGKQGGGTASGER